MFICSHNVDPNDGTAASLIINRRNSKRKSERASYQIKWRSAMIFAMFQANIRSVHAACSGFNHGTSKINNHILASCKRSHTLTLSLALSHSNFRSLMLNLRNILLCNCVKSKALIFYWAHRLVSYLIRMMMLMGWLLSEPNTTQHIIMFLSSAKKQSCFCKIYLHLGVAGI